MAKFIPRSVGRKDDHNPNANPNRGGRGGFVGRFQHRGRGRGRGFVDYRGRGRGRGNRGRGWVPQDRQERTGPVNIVFPDDPRHPDFKKDPRNAKLIKKMREKEERDRKNRKSDDELSHDEMDQDYHENEEMRNMSDEGLRITVENKGGSLSIGDPSFYDEIQPHKSSTERARSKETQSKSQSVSRRRSKSRSPDRANEAMDDSNESLRITVGNECFSKDSKDPPLPEGRLKKKDIRSSQDREDVRNRGHGPGGSRKEEHDMDHNKGGKGRSPVRVQNRPQHRPRDRSGSRDRHGNPRRRSRSYSPSRGRFRPGKYSPDHRPRHDRSRSRSRGRRRRSPRSSYRSYSRSPSRDKYRNHSGRYRSRSRSRSNSPKRGRRWSHDSWSSVSDQSLSPKRGRSSSRSSSRPRDKKPQPKATAPGRDSKPKENPFLDFLNDLDYRKYGTDEKAGKADKAPRIPPWMQDPSKASDIMEIEKYLQSKLNEVENVRKQQRGEQQLPPQTKQQKVEDPPTHVKQVKQQGAEVPSGRPKQQMEEPASTLPQQKRGETARDVLANILAQEITKKLNREKDGEASSFAKDNPGSSAVKKRDNVQAPHPADSFSETQTALGQSAYKEKGNAAPKEMTISPAKERLRSDYPDEDSSDRREARSLDIYSDLISDEPHMRQRNASPPRLQPKPMKSILKRKAETTLDNPLHTSDEYPGEKSVQNKKHLAKTAMPGMAAQMHIEDEDEFLYGDEPADTQRPTSEATLPTKNLSSLKDAADALDDSVYLGGYSGSKDPGWEVYEPPEGSKVSEENFEPEISREEKTAEVPPKKPQPDKLAADPTIQNILKSIGFNFELSKLMQEKAQQSRKKEEEPEAFGIEQSSSFLGSSIHDIASLEPTAKEESLAEKKAKDLQRKESYEERARRYLAEQQRQNAQHSQSSREHSSHDSYYGYQNPPQMDPESKDRFTSINIPENLSALEKLQNQYEDHYRQDYDMGRSNTNQPYRREMSGPNQFPSDRHRERDNGRGVDKHWSDPRDEHNFDKVDRPKQPKPTFPIIYESPPRHEGPSHHDKGSGSSRRTVLPPKSEQRQPSPPPQVRREPSPAEVRKIQSRPMRTNSESDNDEKPVKKVSSMSDRERQELAQEIEERSKRLKALEKELTRLRKQENELMRKKQRQKEGYKDTVLQQNAELQNEIVQQIQVLKKAAEVNVKLLNACRPKPSEDKDERRRRSRSPKSSSSNRAPKQPVEEKARSPSPEPEKKKQSEESDIHYEYFDSGNHWCKQCNHVSGNIYEFFGHLSSKKHMQKVDPYDRPWLDESLKKPNTVVRGQSVAAPLRGVEFLMSTQAFFCSLCKTFSGDMTCAEQHLKSSAHNEKYKEFVSMNPYYERRYNLDKAAGVSMSSVSKEESDDDRRSEERNSREKRSSRSTRRDESPRSRPKERQEPSKRKATYDDDDDDDYRRTKHTEDKKSRRYEPEERKNKWYEPEDIKVKRNEPPPPVKDKFPNLRMDKEPEFKRVVSSAPKPEKSAFGKFTWKGGPPLIGKAPGYKKQASGAESAADSSKISIKLDTKVLKGKAPSQPADMNQPVIQDVEDPAKDPAYILKRKQMKREEAARSPAPLDIFLTLDGGSKSIPTLIKNTVVDTKPAPSSSTSTIPTVISRTTTETKTEPDAPTLSPTTIEDAFGGKIEDVPLPESAKSRSEVKAEAKDESAVGGEQTEN